MDTSPSHDSREIEMTYTSISLVEEQIKFFFKIVETETEHTNYR